jgi:hypothetical protein
MRFAFLSQSVVLVLGGLVACGGSAFSTAPADAGTGPASNDTSSEAAPTRAPVPCGARGTSCSGATPVCCLTNVSGMCAHQACGCETQLECTSDADCAPSSGICCIQNNLMDAACTSGHVVARCAAACSNGSVRMCTPNASGQCAGQQCSTDSGDLQNAGLPILGAGTYGVCK